MRSVSVIVTVYNKRDYLEECVNSIASRDFFEKIVLIDDGSTDGSQELCDTLAKQFANVEVVHQANAGMVAARKRGLNCVNSEYVTFVDADDFYTECSFEKITYIMDEFCPDVIAFGCIRYWNSQKSIYDRGWIFESGLYEKDAIDNILVPKMLFSKNENRWGVDPSLCLKICKLDIIKEQYNRTDLPAISYGEDTSISYPLLLSINSIYYVDMNFYNHRQRESGEAEYFVEDKFFEKLFMLYQYLHKIFCENDHKEILIKQLDCFYMNSVQHHRRKYRDMANNQRRNWLFPFGKIEKNSNVVLYGAGTVGKLFFSQIEKQKYCKVIAWIDRYKQDENVQDISSIQNQQYDYVIIAIDNQIISEEVRKSLVDMGVDENKIIFIGENERI